MNKKVIHMVSYLLVIVGGINWGLIGAFNWGIEDILGSSISRIVYILVGLAAIYELIKHKSCCKMCSSSSNSSNMSGGGSM